MAANSSFLDRIIQNRVLSHLLFWCAFLFTFSLLASLNSGSFKINIVNYLAMLPSQIAAAYTLNYFQVPKLLLKRKYLLFGFSMIICVYIFAAFARWSIVYIAEPLVREEFVQESISEILSDTAYLFSIYFPAVYIYAFIMLIIKAIKSRFEEKHKIEVLQREKVTNELKFLRGQIQPHFLFNTLNNLYALTLAKSDLAPKVVLKLSELLDFILYHSDEKTISISKEIELIKGFIDLESLRYGDTLDLVFNHNVDNDKMQIAPLILMPAIENAFKHGTSRDPKKAKIHIELLINNGHLIFKVFNNKLNDSLKKGHSNILGIGNTNLKRQLEINYPEKHELRIDETSESYSVELNINLN